MTIEETKWDVFEELLDAYDDAKSSNGNLHPTQELLDYDDRYANALPDDIPVVSKEVSNIMITYRFLWWKEFLDKAYNNELNDDEGINYKVRSESAEVARALILGVWRIEETGEIVKLEAEK